MATYYSPKTVTDNLIFYYDIGNVKSYAGEPTTNTNGWGQYNYWWSNAIVGRNVTGPSIPPPITGYEIASLISTDGQDTQTILYTASVDQVNGGVYTHSAYVYLVSGTWATVGQHWNPWDYGVQNYIPKGQWTRISYTLTNSPNNYGAVALSYNTNGMIYITAPQYEKKSHSTPFVYGTRSDAQGLLDLSPTNQTISLSAAGYDSSGIISFDGSSNYINLGNFNLQQNFTLECWAYITGDVSGLFGQGITAGSQGLHVLWYYQGNRGMIFGMYANDLDTPGYTLTYNTWHHFVFTYNHTTYLKQFYADGRLQNSNTGAAYAGSGQFNIGLTYSSNGTPAKGKINMAKVYNKVLTASEVLQNFNATKGRFGL